MVQSKFLRQPMHWLDTNEALAAHCKLWETRKLLCVDSEFIRTRTYYPIAGLLQLNDGVANYLLDPTTIDDFSPLIALLVDPEIVIVLHSCSEDLEVFHRLFGCLPENILDTQIAAAMLGYGYSVGFGNLCQAMLEIDLPKSETRSNWLQRPLTESQMHYAAIDVEYLHTLAIILIKELKAKDRLSWLREECDKLKVKFTTNQDVEQAWTRGKGLRKLNRPNLYFYKTLATWREKEAQARDLPRNRVLAEHTMLELAIELPRTVDRLKNFGGFSPRMVQKDGEKILALVEAAKNIASDHLPERVEKPLSSATKEPIKKLREIVVNKAEQLSLSAELLMRKKDYESLVRSGWQNGEYALPASITGWRRSILNTFFQEALVDAGLPGSGDFTDNTQQTKGED